MNAMYRFDEQSGGASGVRAAKDAPLPAGPAPTAQGEGKIGRRIERVEDGPLLRGKGRYVGDVDVPGGLHAAFVRSPHAHATLLAIDTAAALKREGVVAVLTATDMSRYLTNLRMPLGFPTTALPTGITPFVLTPKEVCFVGEAVAMVIATSRYAAEDGAGDVQVDYAVLPAVSDCRQALEPQAPRVRTDFPDNALTRFTVAYGDCDQAFAQAAHVFKDTLHQHRGGAHPMEGRGVVAEYDELRDTLTVWSSTQMAHELQFTLAELLGVAETRIRVIAPDVGGGFGAKFLIYPEEIAIAAAALHLRQPVKWIEDRVEHFLCSIQERDQFWDVEIAVDAHARVLGIRGHMVHDQGAYTPQGINCPYNAVTGVTGPYVVPNFSIDAVVAQTNKVYTIPVRGAGYPEGAFVMERLLDRVAQGMELDRAEVRRRNLVTVDKLPYVKPLKQRSGKAITLDTGDYVASQETVLRAIDYAGFATRKALARTQGRHIGIGLANAVKGTGRGPFESASVRISATGHISAATGAMAMGQGMRTAMAQIVADVLGVEVRDVQVTSGDTSSISMGIGGFASRQTVTGGSSMLLAARQVEAKARKVAAHLLNVGEDALEVRNGKVQLRSDAEKSVTLAQIARTLRGIPGYDLPAGAGAGLEATVCWEPEAMTYANACHACEVEVDVDTGNVTILRYIALQDCGRLINPLIVEGQVHGGIVHGIGNALFEYMRYDHNAQPLTTTFADYLLPTSTEIPHLELIFTQSPTDTNPLGVKGVGEVGTIPVTAAIASAIDDALSEFGMHVSAIPVDPVQLVRQMEQAA
ncbi:xanthine dehydrogenase family protein molybdopterin-binding subunit [Bordetella sp. H567]|uniref:xanthine dehydrogenase family protein molybdopterin-binding subunit n=1 Tax=Bordetella sp. H567 TaxID=1697043 RepID=UPI000A461B20|nr:xanthine dehydrogenase family protein molybdopterin-binding subunit [Bordetella sp. H567]